jgi:hypothetical protein
MMAISLVAMFNAVVVARKVAHRLGLWNGAIIAGIAYVVVVAIVQMVLPPVNEVPQAFSAVVLWQFRESSIGIHLVLWTFWALAFGYLTERSFSSQTQVGRRAYS